MNRSLKTRVSENISKWLTEAMNVTEYPDNLCDRHPASSIGKHLIESGHKIHTRVRLSMCYSKDKLLHFIEALAIKNSTLDNVFRNNSFTPYNCLVNVDYHSLILIF